MKTIMGTIHTRREGQKEKETVVEGVRIGFVGWSGWEKKQRNKGVERKHV